jgi:hypothetical protein
MSRTVETIFGMKVGFSRELILIQQNKERAIQDMILIMDKNDN